MSNRVLNFIDKSNKILLFVAALIVIIAVGKELVKDIFRKGYTPPTVQVVKSDSKDKGTQEVKLKKRYVGYIKDTHIIELSTNKIVEVQSFSGDAEMMVVSQSSSLGLSSNAVNLMFTNAGSKSKLLFKHNALIVDFSPAQFNKEKYQFKLSKNIYLVAKKDTNNDGVLNAQDTKEILISEYNGEELTQVINDIKGFRVINDDLLLIYKGDDDNLSFHLYNTLSSEMSQIDTELE